MHAQVLIVGCKGVGIEVAKNTVLAGVHTLTLFDPQPTVARDLGSNFYLTPEDVPDADLEREREILREQTRAAAGKPKPPEIVEKIINGKLNKFYTETTLLQQPHLAEEGSPPVSKVLEGLGAEAGAPVELHGFAAFHCGEP